MRYLLFVFAAVGLMGQQTCPSGTIAIQAGLSVVSGIKSEGMCIDPATGIVSLPGGGGGSGLTSVGVTFPVSLLSCTGSPLIANGTIACSFPSGQTPNLVLRTGAGIVSFSALTLADLPVNIPNSALANSSITVNGTSCTLGSSCSPAVGATIAHTTNLIAGNGSGNGSDSMIAVANVVQNISSTTNLGLASSVTPNQATSFCFDGDSVTSGGNGSPATTPVSTYFASTPIGTSWGGTSAVNIHNFAVAGQNIANITARYNTSCHTVRPGVGGITKGYFIFFSQWNDAAANPSTNYAAWVTLWNMAKADGFTIVAETSPQDINQSGQQEIYRINLNMLVYQANGTGAYDYLLDLDSIVPAPNMWSEICCGITQSWLASDGRHPSNYFNNQWAFRLNQMFLVGNDPGAGRQTFSTGKQVLFGSDVLSPHNGSELVHINLSGANPGDMNFTRVCVDGVPSLGNHCMSGGTGVPASGGCTTAMGGSLYLRFNGPPNLYSCDGTSGLWIANN